MYEALDKSFEYYPFAETIATWLPVQSDPPMIR